MDDGGDIAECPCGLEERVNRFLRGHVRRCCADVESGVEHGIGCGGGVLVVQVGYHDVLPGADASGDCLTDRPCSDDNSYFAHGEPFSCGDATEDGVEPTVML